MVTGKKYEFYLQKRLYLASLEALLDSVIPLVASHISLLESPRKLVSSIRHKNDNIHRISKSKKKNIQIGP